MEGKLPPPFPSIENSETKISSASSDPILRVKTWGQSEKTNLTLGLQFGSVCRVNWGNPKDF